MSDLIGKTITKVRSLTPQELFELYWSHGQEACLVLELDDGSTLFPGRDAEGNGPGALWGHVPGQGYATYFPAPAETGGGS